MRVGIVVSLLAFLLLLGCIESNPQPSPYGPPDTGEHNVRGDQTSVGMDLLADVNAPSGDALADDLAASEDDGLWDGTGPGEVLSDILEDSETLELVDVPPDPDLLPAECVEAIPIACGAKVSHDTGVDGRDNVWSGYGMSARLESGPEVLYRFHSAAQGPVSVRISGLESDLDLFILEQCDPFAGLEFAATPMDIQKGEEVITFLAQADTHYYIVVDGYDGAQGAYEMALECTELAPALEFGGGEWMLLVDRQLSGFPAEPYLPSDMLPEEAYSAIESGETHTFFIPRSGSWAGIDDSEHFSKLTMGTPEAIIYDVTSMLGGRFAVWQGPEGLQAELSFFGSGVPIVSSVRGSLQAVVQEP